MSIKKRFTIAPDLAKGLRSSIQSASTNQGQMHYDIMSIDAIVPDPNNPRKLTISLDELLNGINPNDPHYSIKQDEYESLIELSESIKRIGIRNAIEVYKDGPKYRIITGERRYLSAILAGQKSVPVRINSKPDDFNLRYTQWVENINRQDLNLWEKFNNLLLMAEAYQKGNQTQLTEKVLQHLLGISSIQAYRYFCLLKANSKIIDLIRSSKLNNLKLVQELVTMKDPIACQQIITWIEASKNEVTSLASYKQAAVKTTSKVKNKDPVKLGKINNIEAAQLVLDILLSDTRLTKYQFRFKNIDKTSPKSIMKAFKTLFKLLETELCYIGPM